MSRDDRHVQMQLADLGAVIERATGDLSLCEEPSGFVVALDDDGTEEERR